MRSLKNLLESVRYAYDPAEPARDFAEMAVPSSCGPFWSDAARKLVSAVALHVGRDPDYTGLRNLDGVAAVLSMPAAELAALPYVSQPFADKAWSSVVAVARSGIS